MTDVSRRRCSAPARAIARAVAIVMVFAPIALRAQTLRESIDRAVELYRGLAFSEASTALREVMARPEALRLPDTTQARALAYMGAAEVHLGRVPTGEVAFRDALARAPQFRLDTLEFPPGVSAVFEASRRRTAFVLASTARETVLVAGQGRVEFRLKASAPHAVRVGLCEAGGARSRMLYQGVIGDTLVVAWDGYGETASRPLQGALDLCVESTGYDGVSRSLRLPLRVSVVTADGREVGPVPSEVATTRRSRRDLYLAAGAATMALVLPQVVAPDAPRTGRRFIVSAAVISAALFPRPTARPRIAEAPGSALPANTAVRMRVRALRDSARSEAP